MNPLIEQHMAAIQALCVEYGVTRLEIFGSAATEAFDPDRSDVDFVMAGAIPKHHFIDAAAESRQVLSAA